MECNFLKFSDNKFRKKIEPIILDQKLNDSQKKSKITSGFVQYLLLGKHFSESFVREISGYLDQYYMVQNDHININFLRQFRDRLKNQDLTNYLKQNKNKDIKIYQEFKDKIDWLYVSKIPYRFSFDFLQKYKDKIYWFWLSNWYNLTQEFIDKFANQDLDWQYITNAMDLTEQFIEKYHDKLNMYEIIYNKQFKFSNEFKKKHPLYFLK